MHSMDLLVIIPILFQLFLTGHPSPHSADSSFLWGTGNAFYNSDMVKELLRGNLSGVVENFQSVILWDTIHSGCQSMLDHDSKLARQAKKMADAENQEDPLVFGDAALELFYGDEEDEETHRMKRDSGLELGLGDWLEMAAEVFQQEYFLNHFREEHVKKGMRTKRGASRLKRQATMGGVLAGTEELVDIEDDDQDSQGQQLYAPYLADIAYFFPMLEFYIPFNGSFQFFQQPYNLFKTSFKR